MWLLIKQVSATTLAVAGFVKGLSKPAVSSGACNPGIYCELPCARQDLWQELAEAVPYILTQSEGILNLMLTVFIFILGYSLSF